MTIYYLATRKRISSHIIGYGLHLFFLGLSFKNAVKALSFLLLTKVSHVSIWNWLQKYRPWKFLKKNNIKAYIMDETAIKAGSSKLIWLWLIIEPTNKEILANDISKKRNISIAKRFLSQIVKSMDYMLSYQTEVERCTHKPVSF